MIARTVAFSVLLTCAACGYHPRDRDEPRLVGHDQAGAALTFGDIDHVEGTRFFTLPIVRIERESSGGSFSKYAGGDERNRLIVDSTTGDIRRVLPSADYSINWIEPDAQPARTGADAAVEAAADGDPASRSTGVYAAVVKRPGAAEKDPATYDLLFGRFEDGKQAWAARGLTEVRSVWLTPDRKLAVIAATAKGAIFRLYDPASFNQLLEKELTL